MKYFNTEIYKENGWYKADVWKQGIVGRYLETVMADTLSGIKELIKDNK